MSRVSAASPGPALGLGRRSTAEMNSNSSAAAISTLLGSMSTPNLITRQSAGIRSSSLPGSAVAPGNSSRRHRAPWISSRNRKLSTYRNYLNVSREFINEIIEYYEGTRIGRQELHADILDDSELALWKRKWIDDSRVYSHPYLSYITVGVDPGDVVDTGIVVAGRNQSGSDGYVLSDDSVQGGPEVWGKQVWASAIKFNANCIVPEKNHGGLMVAHTLETYRPPGCFIPIKEVWASTNKAARAQPFAALTEQGRIHHVGTFAELENELCGWEPSGKEPSPNRLDAAVWALYGLDIVSTKLQAGVL